LSAVCPQKDAAASLSGVAQALRRPPEIKNAAPAGTGNGENFGGTLKTYRGKSYRNVETPASRFTWEGVDELAVRLRLEKSASSRLTWALASMLSLDKEDREALVEMLKHSRAFMSSSNPVEVGA
jgi:hypothetical protein